MRAIFITPSAQALKRWQAAFPLIAVFSSTEAFFAGKPPGERLLWLDIAGFERHAAIAAIQDLNAVGEKVIALTIAPSDEEAFALLSAGARGYCHAEAVPEQLQEVAAAIDAGGYWMPPGLVQRLLASAIQSDATAPQPSVGEFSRLTQREYAVAVEVGKGLNNREISEVLGVTERTVKAHLTAIFEKLQLRDRVQLALVVNRLPKH